MYEYHREKFHVNHFWELKGRLVQKGYNKKKLKPTTDSRAQNLYLCQANCKNSPLKLLCNWHRTPPKFNCKFTALNSHHLLSLSVHFS